MNLPNKWNKTLLSFFLSFFFLFFKNQIFNKKLTFNKKITTQNSTVFISLENKKKSYTLSCIKQNVYTFLFYFLYLSNKKITTQNSTVFISLENKKKSYTLSCIKQNVHTFLFYFLYLSCSHSSHSLRHPSLGLSTSSFTLL